MSTMNLPNRRTNWVLFWFSKIAQCDVFSYGTVDLLVVNGERYKMWRDEKGSCPYLMELEVLFCNLVGKAVLGAAKIPQFVDSAYVLFQVTSNNHFHIFQSKPDYWYTWLSSIRDIGVNIRRTDDVNICILWWSTFLKITQRPPGLWWMTKAKTFKK